MNSHVVSASHRGNCTTMWANNSLWIGQNGFSASQLFYGKVSFSSSRFLSFFSLLGASSQSVHGGEVMTEQRGGNLPFRQPQPETEQRFLFLCPSVWQRNGRRRRLPRAPPRSWLVLTLTAAAGGGEYHEFFLFAVTLLRSALDFL